MISISCYITFFSHLPFWWKNKFKKKVRYKSKQPLTLLQGTEDQVQAETIVSHRGGRTSVYVDPNPVSIKLLSQVAKITVKQFWCSNLTTLLRS